MSLVLALVACATPPDVQPFADATAALELTVGSTERFARAEIAPIDAALGTTLAEDFGKAWEHRLKAMRAMNDYASSLVAVVGAADQGAVAAREVLDSAETLFTTLGAAYPLGSEVGQKIASGAVAAYRVYAQDRAARTVAQALQQADPAVQEVADVLAADFATMHLSLETLHKQALASFDAESKGRFAVIGQVQTLEDQLEGLNQGLGDQLEKIQAAQALAELLAHERALPDYAAYLAARDALEQRYAAYAATTRAAADLVQAWGRTHRELIRAAEQRRAGGFQTLVALSEELLDLYRQARKTP